MKYFSDMDTVHNIHVWLWLYVNEGGSYCQDFMHNIRYFISRYIICKMRNWQIIGGRHDHDCMVVGLLTTYAISAYHH